MKILRFVSVAFVASLIVVNLASCTKEGDPQYNLVKNEKKLLKLDIEEPYYRYSYQFSYDNEGRLYESTHTYYDGHEENIINCTYSWKNNEITEQHGHGWPYELSNGLIRKYGYETGVKYDNDQYLSETKTTESGSNYYSIVWGSNDGRLSRSGRYYKKDKNSAMLEYLLNFYYTGEEATICNGFNPLVSLFAGFYNEYVCIAHPELVGVRTNFLPNTFAETYYSIDGNGRPIEDRQRGNFSYKFDSDRYIIECIMSYGDWEKKYTMTWE